MLRWSVVGRVVLGAGVHRTRLSNMRSKQTQPSGAWGAAGVAVRVSAAHASPHVGFCLAQRH
jgi:hypothetical protein